MFLSHSLAQTAFLKKSYTEDIKAQALLKLMMFTV